MKTTRELLQSSKTLWLMQELNTLINAAFSSGEGVQSEAIDLKYVPSDEIVADILTKPLAKERLKKLLSGLGMANIK